MKLFFSLIFCCLIFSSCQPLYKRLTRGNWEKDTTWVRFTDLPLAVADTIKDYGETDCTLDKSDDIDDIISLDVNKQFSQVEYYDAYNFKLVPFGLYFKLGKKRYFMDRHEISTPLVYYNGILYFSTGEYFEKNVKEGDCQIGEKAYKNKIAYDKLYYVKYIRKF